MRLMASVLGMLFIACVAFSSAWAEVDVKALYEDKCSMCHDIDRSSSIRMSAAGWRETVERMKNENGCQLTNEEMEAIIGYLVQNRGKK